MADYPKSGDHAGYDYLSIAQAVVTGDVDQTIDGSKTFLNEIIALGGVTGADSGYSGYSGDNPGTSGYSGYSGTAGASGYSGYSGISGYSGMGTSGYSGMTGDDGVTGVSGYSGKSGYSGYSGQDAQTSGYSGYSGISGYSGYSGISGYSGFSGISGFSGYSGTSGYSGAGDVTAGIFSLGLAVSTDVANTSILAASRVVLFAADLEAAKVVGCQTNTPNGIYVSSVDAGVGFTVTHDNHADAAGATFRYIATI